MFNTSTQRRYKIYLVALLSLTLAVIFGMRSPTTAISNSIYRRLLIASSSKASSTQSIISTTSRSFIASSASHSSFNMDPSKMSTPDFMQAVALRRSIYALNSNSSISDKRIQDLTFQTLRTVPSAFNSQTTRLVVLLKSEHQKFWTMTKEIFLAEIKDEKAAENLGKKLDGFGKAYGSILFFENEATVKALQEKTPLYAKEFPDWSEATSAMHQFVLWTALTSEGLGCNLQHYHTNAKVEGKAKETWDLPAEWQLKAQLVFGGVEEGGRPTTEKDKIPVEETSRFFGGDL